MTSYSHNPTLTVISTYVLVRTYGGWMNSTKIGADGKKDSCNNLLGPYLYYSYSIAICSAMHAYTIQAQLSYIATA